MKRLLTFILIVTHVLINCVWASAHLNEDFDNHGHDSPHIHLSTLLSVMADVDGDINHDNEAHIHLTYYFCSIDSFNFEQSMVQKRSDFQIPFENHAFSPPIPPPIA